MGFRSTLLTECLNGIKLPKWFIKKYNKKYGFVAANGDSLSVALLEERSFYNPLESIKFLVDLQKIIKRHDTTISVCLLHECGGITLVRIGPDSIKGYEPETWQEVKRVRHNCCYGCLDKQILRQKEESEKLQRELEIAKSPWRVGPEMLAAGIDAYLELMETTKPDDPYLPQKIVNKIFNAFDDLNKS